MSWTILGHMAAPASDIFEFTGLSVGAYQRLVLMLDDVAVGTDGAMLNLQLYTDGVLRTTGYRIRSRGHASSGSDFNQSSQSTSIVRVIGSDGLSANGVGNAAEESAMARVEISNLASGRYKLVLVDGVAVIPAGSVERYINCGCVEHTGAVTGVKVMASTGVISSGLATLYGLTTS